jgi:hypothetical protein
LSDDEPSAFIGMDLGSDGSLAANIERMHAAAFSACGIAMPANSARAEPSYMALRELLDRQTAELEARREDYQQWERDAVLPAMMPSIEVRQSAWLPPGSAFMHGGSIVVSSDVWDVLMMGVQLLDAVAACRRWAKRRDFEILRRVLAGRSLRFIGVRDGHPGGGRAARRRGEARKRRAAYLRAWLIREVLPLPLDEARGE